MEQELLRGFEYSPKGDQTTYQDSAVVGRHDMVVANSHDSDKTMQGARL